ncbi:MAG: hypothetical protein PHG48_02365 [Eubacteriales bacterium]|nr:hypothetical protein [Eubacteriales bacterium]
MINDPKVNDTNLEVKNIKTTDFIVKGAFVGFGEINTPEDIIIRKCGAAAKLLEDAGIVLNKVFPVKDDPSDGYIRNVISTINEKDFDFLILCVAGWIPTHTVIRVTEEFRHKPMVLWGLSGWTENGRLITTADQAGTTALRKVMSDLGYKFKFVYDIAGKPSKSASVAVYGLAAAAARKLRRSKAGMMGYRDMNLYGTLYDGVSLKKVVGPEIETFEMLEVVQRSEAITRSLKHNVLTDSISKWEFLKPADESALLKGAGYYLALKEIIKGRGYDAVSLKDVDGMKKLLSFPPAMIFMLLADEDGICTIPENDSLGCITQLVVKYLTGQAAAYLEFYEFMEDGVLAGVPDYVPAEITDGTVRVIPAAFGGLSEGILNVSKLKTGKVTLCRLAAAGNARLRWNMENDGPVAYCMHVVTGEALTPPKWEEAGWAQPAPQLPGLKIKMEDVGDFASKVMSQHYIISYGDNTQVIRELCGILGISVI